MGQGQCLPCSSPPTCSTSSSVPLPRRLCRWLVTLRAKSRPRAVASICFSSTSAVLMKERNVSGPLVHPLPNGSRRNDLLVDLGHDNLNRVPGLLQVRQSLPRSSSLRWTSKAHWLCPTLLCSCKTSKIVPTKLLPPACKLASNLRAHVRFTHGFEKKARNSFASLGSALSCVTKTLFGVPQERLVAECREPPVTPSPPSCHCHRATIDTHKM